MIDLTRFNTLRLPAKAKKFIEINSEADIKKLPSENNIFLGEGANVLFRSPQLDQVAKINLKGKKILKETADAVTVEVAAGENWHDFVIWSVNNNWSGIENMSLIPGKVGAAAVGNIAAYGQNQEDVFVKLQSINLKTQKREVFFKKDMLFGYRQSVFKTKLLNHLITSATYKLSKTAHFDIAYHSRYESLQSELAKFKRPYTPKNIAQAVINLRTVKQPDIKKIGTAGSFFKNPTVNLKLLKTLKSCVSELQFYPLEKLSYQIQNWEVPAHLPDNSKFKIPAGRLLDELGWRNKRIGNVGTFEKHALVVVTYPGATGPEVWEFAENMRADVKKNFGIDLEYEVVVI